MEAEKKTRRGAKLELNRQAGQASGAGEVVFTESGLHGCFIPSKTYEIPVHYAACEINKYDLFLKWSAEP